jgi:hypothetical protein
MPGNDDRLNPWRYASAGIEFIVTFGLLLGAGLMVDRWIRDTVPVFTLVGAVAGFAAGLWRLIRVGRDMQRLGKDKDDQRRPPD